MDKVPVAEAVSIDNHYFTSCITCWAVFLQEQVSFGYRVQLSCVHAIKNDGYCRALFDLSHEAEKWFKQEIHSGLSQKAEKRLKLEIHFDLSHEAEKWLTQEIHSDLSQKAEKRLKLEIHFDLSHVAEKWFKREIHSDLSQKAEKWLKLEMHIDLSHKAEKWLKLEIHLY